MPTSSKLFPKLTLCSSSIILLILTLFFSAILVLQITYYTYWMKPFVNPHYNIRIIAYFSASALLTIYLLPTILSLNTQNKKTIFFVSFTIVIILLFLSIIMLIASIVKPPEYMSEGCQKYGDYVSAYNKSSQVLCGPTCQCYLFDGTQFTSVFSNMSTQYTQFAWKVQDCWSWNSTLASDSISYLQSTYGCSGWCKKQPIFYFSKNHISVLNNKGQTYYKRRGVKESCYEFSQRMVDVMFWRVVVGSTSCMVVVCLVLLSLFVWRIKNQQYFLY